MVEFPRERTAGVSSRSITVTNKSNSLTKTVASSHVCTSPLTVITVVGFLDIFMVSNLAELRSFWLTRCILAPGSTTNSLSSSSFIDVTGNTHSSGLVFLFELVFFFSKIPCLASGASQLSFTLFWRSVLKFQSVGTSLMRNFDLYLSKRWFFLFPDTCLT